MSKLKQQLDAQSLETQAEQQYRSLKSDMDKAKQATTVSPSHPTPFRQPENKQGEFMQTPNGRIPPASQSPNTPAEQDTDMEY